MIHYFNLRITVEITIGMGFCIKQKATKELINTKRIKICNKFF